MHQEENGFTDRAASPSDQHPLMQEARQAGLTLDPIPSLLRM